MQNDLFFRLKKLFKAADIFSVQGYLVVFFSLCSSLLFAQQSITGKVTAADKPVAGATVQVKGSKTTTQTDENGVFTINAASNASLLITSVGFVTQEISINGRSSLSVVLLASLQDMGEVVVIGYGTARKKDLTGAVANIKGDDLKAVSVADASSLLQGKAAGVIVQNSGGAPGQAPAIVIRGSGTFGNDQPLYVIDGMIASSMAFVNPNDIASIDILKDASAAAIYGSRAANGVVLVTTKTGTTGIVKINFNAKYGTQSPTHTLKFVNARQYAVWNNLAHDNDGTP
ncbi:MAG: TonB-dependent receptor plug domain-containing protein, partial [Ferruginibacter sp.]|nr:TonB-dependent receptor plug domain-containing protein [Ferruginibacter sp.]